MKATSTWTHGKADLVYASALKIQCSGSLRRWFSLCDGVGEVDVEPEGPWLALGAARALLGAPHPRTQSLKQLLMTLSVMLFR